MKRFLAAFLMCLVPLMASAVGMEFYNASGTIPTKVSASNPLPVTAAVTIASASFTASGSLDARITSTTITLPVSIAASIPVTIASCTTPVTTAEIPLVSYLVNTVEIGTTPSTLSSPMAGRKFCAIVNLGTETVWVNAGSVGIATVSEGIPVAQNTYWSDTVGAGVDVHFVCSNTQNISVVQGK